MLFVRGVLLLMISSMVAGGCLNVITNCGASGSGDTDDTAAFQKCVDESEGCVYVPEGRYGVTGVLVAVSNLVIRISPSATLMLHSGAKSCEPLFSVGAGGKAATVKNVTIQGDGGSFEVDLSRPFLSPWTVRAVMFRGGLDGFLLEGMNVRMANPARDAVAVSPSVVPAVDFDPKLIGGKRFHPTHGMIRNVAATGQIFGYGTVQMESGEHIMFVNVSGEGGATIRLETDGMAGGYLNNITATHIYCKDGHAAFISEPHNQINGIFTVSDVISDGCHVAVQLDGGYVRDGKSPGIFSNLSSVAGVTATYGTHSQGSPHAQPVPSCAGCGTENTVLNYHVAVGDVVTIGFPPPSNRSACVFWKRPGCGYT